MQRFAARLAMFGAFWLAAGMAPNATDHAAASARLLAPDVTVTQLPPPLRDRLGTGRIVAVSRAPSSG